MRGVPGRSGAYPSLSLRATHGVSTCHTSRPFFSQKSKKRSIGHWTTVNTVLAPRLNTDLAPHHLLVKPNVSRRPPCHGVRYRRAGMRGRKRQACQWKASPGVPAERLRGMVCTDERRPTHRLRRSFRIRSASISPQACAGLPSTAATACPIPLACLRRITPPSTGWHARERAAARSG